MASAMENDKFVNELISSTLLDDAIEWIQSNMRPDEVFEEEELCEWAEDNGYSKDE